MGTLERADEYINRWAEAPGNGPACVIGMVWAGQPPEGGEEARIITKALRGVGCQLDLQSRVEWRRHSSRGGSRGKDMEGS